MEGQRQPFHPSSGFLYGFRPFPEGRTGSYPFHSETFRRGYGMFWNPSYFCSSTPATSPGRVWLYTDFQLVLSVALVTGRAFRAT